MSSTALYKAFIEVGATEDSAVKASEDVVQMSELANLATKADIARLENNTKADFARLENSIVQLEGSTKADIARLESSTKADIARLEVSIAQLEVSTKTDIAQMETRLLKWFVGCGFLFAGIIIAGVGLLIQVMLSSIVG